MLAATWSWMQYRCGYSTALPALSHLPPCRSVLWQELFCVFSLVVQIMMPNAQFDDTGSITTAGFLGQMHVDMVFSDETNDATGQTN